METEDSSKMLVLHHQTTRLHCITSNPSWSLLWKCKISHKILLYYTCLLHSQRLWLYCFQEVATIFQDETYFISLIERKRTEKRLVFSAPIFVAHFPGHPYFFVSQSGKKDDVLHVSFDTSEPSLLARILAFHTSRDLCLIWVVTLQILNDQHFRITYCFDFQGRQ